MRRLQAAGWPSRRSAAARLLDTKCKVPYEILDLPIGLEATDAFVDTLRRNFHTDVPDEINGERGRLLNMISNMHQYTYNKCVALWGDPDQLVALTQFLVLLNMRPVYIVTGTLGNNFIDRINPVLKGTVPEVKVLRGAEAAACLRDNQLEGIRQAATAGIRVKVNSVLIPGINEAEMVPLAKTLKQLNVSVMNIMPLIPQADFTCLQPVPEHLHREIREQCAPFMNQISHCRQCLADACGLLEKAFKC